MKIAKQFSKNSSKHQLSSLRHPIRENGEGLIGLVGVVIGDMDSKVMWPAHIAVHHELHRQYRRFTWLEGHRTDGRYRRSTPLAHFDIRRLGKTQRLVADVLQFKRSRDGFSQFYVSKIDLLLIDL